MVAEAERLLAQTGWLPEVLRLPDDAAATADHMTAALPAFLTKTPDAIAAE